MKFRQLAFTSCRKGKVIEMKRKDTVEGVSRKFKFELNGKTFFKGLGAKLSIVIAGVLVVGAVSITALADFEAITPSDANTEASTTTTQNAPTTGATAVSATMSWWKAGVFEYALTQVEEVTEPVTTVTEKTSGKATTVKERKTVKETATVATRTTSTTAEKEKTTEKAKTAEKEKKAEKDNKSTKIKGDDKKPAKTVAIDVLYVQEDVKMREKPSKSADVIKIVKQGTRVDITGKEEKGFYPVKIGNKSGYIMASYLGSKSSNVTTTKESTSKEYIGTFKVTAYTAGSSARTASGTTCKAGRTIAAPSRFAFGTKLMFDGNVYTVEDRGGAIVNNVLDLYVDSQSEAVQWGVRYLEVYKVNN